MKLTACLFLFLFCHIQSQWVQAESSGHEIFQTRCMACHTVGEGQRVGPDLAGVDQRRSETWIIQFVKSSQSLIKKGDPDAVSLFEKFNKIVMPDHALSNAEIKSVIAFIKSSNKQASSDSRVQEEVVMTSEDINRGQDLFQGKIRFARGGPSCISCHHVKNDAVIGGGILAKDLTTVFSRLGGSGVRVILGQPPFPVMQRAYMEKPITEEENRALIAFLKYADENHYYQRPRDYGVRLVASGVMGMFLLMGLYGVIWFRRKKEAVNKTIFDRQVKSESDVNHFM